MLRGQVVPDNSRASCYIVVSLEASARAVTPPFCISTVIDLQVTELELQRGLGAGSQINDINDIGGDTLGGVVA